MNTLRRLAARLTVITLVSGALLAIPAPASATESITVSVTNPMIGEQVTIRATGFANPQDYDILYVVGVDDYFPGAENDSPYYLWIGELDSGGNWSGSWLLDFLDGDFLGGIYPGVVTLRAKSLRAGPEDLGSVGFADLEDVGVQLFPGKNRIGSPKLSFSGPGYVNGSFVIGEEFTVTGTGFPAGAVLAIAIVFPNPNPSNDVSLDFWRYFFEEGLGEGGDSFFILAEGDSPSVLAGGGVGQDLAGKSIWLYYVGELNDESELPQFGYGVYTVDQLKDLSKTSRGISNYFIAEGFDKGKSKLKKSMRAFIAKELNTRSGEIRAVCTGTVRGKKWTAKKEALALARAKAGCDFVTRISPNLPVELKKRLIPKGKGDPLTVRIRVFY